jgi:hypothetical protein
MDMDASMTHPAHLPFFPSLCLLLLSYLLHRYTLNLTFTLCFHFDIDINDSRTVNDISTFFHMLPIKNFFTFYPPPFYPATLRHPQCSCTQHTTSRYTHCSV